MHRLPDVRAGVSTTGIDIYAGGDCDGRNALRSVRTLRRGVSGSGDGDIRYGIFDGCFDERNREGDRVRREA